MGSGLTSYVGEYIRDAPEDASERHSQCTRTIPMILDIDIWRCAALMIKQYGDNAAVEAAARADEYREKDELDGEWVWVRITEAIDELSKVQPGEIRQ